MRLFNIFACSVFCLALVAYRSAFASTKLVPLQTVPFVDLNRYLGEWYEIARYPNRFQKGCQDSRAMYSLMPDGDIKVLNSCRNEKDGSLRQVKGRAWVVDRVGNARLKVSFFWPFRGDYWIIDLGKEYEYAVVGTPNRKYLWILCRSPEIPQDVFAGIMERLEKQGYSRSNLLIHRAFHPHSASMAAIFFAESDRSIRNHRLILNPMGESKNDHSNALARHSCRRRLFHVGAQNKQEVLDVGFA